MADLRDIFAAAGCAAVQTYIQSGNAVFEAALTTSPKPCQRLWPKPFSRDLVTRRRSSCVLSEELRHVANSNPFDTSGDPRSPPCRVSRRTLPPPRPYPVSTRIVRPRTSSPCWGRDVYLRYPNGVARSKLTNDYLTSRLKTVSTMRNWRTVLRLLEMVDAP